MTEELLNFDLVQTSVHQLVVMLPSQVFGQSLVTAPTETINSHEATVAASLSDITYAFQADARCYSSCCYNDRS